MYPFASKISGTHALVTGGTKGIGRLIVQALLAEGANVSYCARNPRGDEFSAFQGAADNARAVGSTVDIANPTDIKKWVKKSVDEFGRIDFVVANASPIYQDPTPEHWERSFNADIIGLISLLEATEPYLVERARAGGSPSVVVITSLAGYDLMLPIIGSPYTTFTRAKAVIAKDYARKFAPLGIRVNTLALGLVETPNITHPDNSVEWSTYQTFKKNSPGVLEALEDKVPLKRAGECEEIANVVVFLASNLSSYVCGATIAIDGSLSTALV